jgi:outer membrane immunogenic protein
VKIRILACVGALTICNSATLLAADLSVPPPILKAPIYAPPAMFTWSGFYIGANFGYGWGSGSGTVTYNTLAPIGATGPISGKGDGFFGGGQIGYNFQSGSIVYGVETDIQLSNGKGTFSGNAGAVTFSGTTETEWFGTFRGRLGYAMDRWLLYATAGLAYARNSASGTDSLGRTFSGSELGWTWTAGAGVETALWGRWSLKGEYLYLGTPNKVPVQPGTSIDGSAHTHLVRAGVNYKF